MDGVRGPAPGGLHELASVGTDPHTQQEHRFLGGQSDGLKRVGRCEGQCAPIRKGGAIFPWQISRENVKAYARRADPVVEIMPAAPAP